MSLVTASALDSGKSKGRLSSFLPDKRTLTEALIKDQGVTLGRCREADRNTPWCARSANAYASAVVGYGIRPSAPQVARKRQREKIMEAWAEFAEEADADGRTDIYGLQALAARELFVAGEIFFRRRWRRPEDGLTVPFQLQALRSEMLPIWLSGDAGDVGDTRGAVRGNTVYAGVEFDRLGRRVAYHFLRQDPGEAAYKLLLRYQITDPGQFVRVPAEDVVHIFKGVEPGQVRGLSPMAAGLVRVWETDRYMDAQLARQHAAALIALIVKPGFDGQTPFSRAAADGETADPEAALDAPGRQIEDLGLEPGTMMTLRPGEEASTLELPDIGGEFDNFIFRAACDVAVAFGIPYSLMTGDLRRTSFANERSAVQAFKRDVQQIQFATMVFQGCRPIWRWFMDAATDFGALNIAGYRANPKPYLRNEWIPAEWEWVDPLKDMQAKLLAVESKIIPRSYVQSSMGYDPEETDAEILRSDARRQEMVDFMPSAGNGSPAQPAEDKPDPDEEDAADGDQGDDGTEGEG